MIVNVASLAGEFARFSEKFILTCRWSLQEVLVNVLSNFPPRTGETHEVSLSDQGQTVVDGVKPVQLDVIEEFCRKKS